jgi:hypothetical protein
LSQFGVNFFSPGSRASGPGSTVGTAGTQQFPPPALGSLTANAAGGSTTRVTSNFTLSDLLNVFVFRADIDLGVTIRALQQNNL